MSDATMFFSMMAVLLMFVGISVAALIWVIINNRQYEKEKAKRR